MPTPAEKAVANIVQMEMDHDHCYRLGRLIAVAEWIVKAANGGRAADKLYETANARATRTSPISAYVYLAKSAQLACQQLGSDPRRSQLDRLLTQVAAETGDDLPERMTTAQTSRMSSGYWHQHGALLASDMMASRREYEEAMQAAKDGAARLVAAGMSEVEAANRVGIARLTLRAAQGKTGRS